jgi:hypothetical protein
MTVLVYVGWWIKSNLQKKAIDAKIDEIYGVSGKEDVRDLNRNKGHGRDGNEAIYGSDDNV